MFLFKFTSLRSTRSRVLGVAAGAVAAAASMAAPSLAGTVTFGGNGVGQSFGMDFVTIGNPGNAADTTGAPNPAGSVGRTFDINTFEVSRGMIEAYNANPGVVRITMQDMSAGAGGSNNGGNGVDRPATGTSWNEAARFVNWLNTQKGFAPAYKFTTNGFNDNIVLWDQTADPLDFDASNRYRSKRSNFFLPSFNEWYKAAYYDPSANSGAGGYWDYANGSNTAPTAVAGGTAANTAVYLRTASQGPADVKNAGGLSPYGVMGLGGNAIEWEESSGDLLNSAGSSDRAYRGGAWQSVAERISASWRVGDVDPTFEDNELGFRVASYNSDAVVPEPSMMVIGMVFGLGGLAAKRRLKK
jgi:formylglycine-generating enzyme required for sulfatase activity